MEGQTIKLILCLFCGLLIHYSNGVQNTSRRFEIDYANDRFLKDGEPFRYVSGSVHYIRVLPTEWADRLHKLRMAGFNVVQTYVEWSSHEPEPGVYDFTGINDLEAFVKTAQQQDLLVILRLGPFICAERDMGGLPYWLLRLNPDVRLRTSDPAFLNPVDIWLGDVILPKIKPLLYENGGPVIMVQVENEYGNSAPCDYTYTSHLRDLFRSVLGDEVVLFTVDSTNTLNLRCGKIPQVYATVDFGIGTVPEEIFALQRLFEPKGPLVNTEFYPGWLDHWGEPHNTQESQKVADAMDKILSLNASVSMYVFHGGTNFGLTTGSNLGTRFQACPTSYDYDAPLSEAGDPTDKYHALREVIQKYLPLPPGPVPPVSEKGDYGTVYLQPLGTVRDVTATLEPQTHPYPLTFEELYTSTGIVIYETTISFRIPDPARLSLKEIHDRAYVFVDNELVGVVSREQELYDVSISTLPNEANEHILSIIVESQGRISVGPHLNDFKGITTNVTLNGYTLKDWKMTTLPLSNMADLNSALQRLQQLRPRIPGSGAISILGTPQGGMTFYKGSFNITKDGDRPKDSFLRLDGWRKGIVWVNDFCLGRYWPEVGPQVTLYVPGAILELGSNSILVLELEVSPCQGTLECSVKFQVNPELAGPTPK